MPVLYVGCAQPHLQKKGVGSKFHSLCPPMYAPVKKLTYSEVVNFKFALFSVREIAFGILMHQVGKVYVLRQTGRIFQFWHLSPFILNATANVLSAIVLGMPYCLFYWPFVSSSLEFYIKRSFKVVYVNCLHIDLSDSGLTLIEVKGNPVDRKHFHLYGNLRWLFYG